MASIKVCQPGFDVNTCPDWAYLFNSDWPSLAIVYEKVVTATSTHTDFKHNLPYPPLTMVYDASSTSYGRLNQVEITNTYVIIEEPGTWLIRCYNVDISKDVNYPLPQAAQAKLPYDKNFGFKQVKNGRQIASNNLNDFIIHTRAQSPAVLTVATQNGQYYEATGGPPYGPYPSGGPAIVYPLQTDYIPFFVAYSEIDAGYWIQITTEDITYDSTNHKLIVITGNALYNGASLIVLRDPLFYPNVLEVTY